MLRKLYFAMLVLVVTLLLAACGTPAAEPADETGAEEAAASSDEPAITITEPFARASVPNGAVYMSILNEGGADDTLISAEADVAESVELHETAMDENDMMQMSPIENVPVPAGGSAVLEPGGKHVMLIGVQAGLAVGDTFDLTLTFEKSGTQTVQVEVTEGMTMDHNMEDGEMEDGQMEDGQAEHDMEIIEEGEAGSEDGG